jgi:hypothetical protein
MIEAFEDWGNPWAATPEMLMVCSQLAMDAKADILEAGSGLTTLVMAASNPDIIVHALEHDMGWLLKLQTAIWRNGIHNIVLHHAPLKNHGVYRWYDDQLIPNKEFSLAVCDGPPRKMASRKGFFDLCAERIRNAVIVLDDAIDPAQIDVLNEWSGENQRRVSLMGEQRPFAISMKEAA